MSFHTIKRRCLQILLIFSFTFSLFSCNAYKGLYYLEDAYLFQADSLSLTKGVHEPKILPNDILSITVSSDIKGATEDFNLPLIPTNSDLVQQTRVSSSNASTGTLQNYLVDKDGIVNFPVLGQLKLSGMTLKEAQDYITNSIYPQYVAKKPIVNIRQLNFEVTVLGEVKNPGLYKSDNGQITILDALAAAGDMTIYGKRDNVLLVRTKENGELAFHQINLNSRTTALDKDLFYMQQNDKLYIHTNKARGNSSRFGSLETIGLSALTLIISVVAIITR